MCTLIVFRDVDPRYPLVVAANRDEVPGRHALTAGPAWLTDDIFCPRDLVHGGSWIGVNRHGLLAALTNRSIMPRSKGRRSRGLLVTEALACRTADEAAAGALAAPSGTYNGFHLFLADGRGASLLWCDGAAVESRPVTAGLHVITGDGCDPGHSVRDGIIRACATRSPRLEDQFWLDRLLSFHGPNSDDGTCVHGPDVRMETGFSMTVHRPANGRFWRVDWRAGRPCRGGGWHAQIVPITDGES